MSAAPQAGRGAGRSGGGGVAGGALPTLGTGGGASGLLHRGVADRAQPGRGNGISPDARSARSVNNPTGLPDRTTITPTFTCYFNTKSDPKHHVHVDNPPRVRGSVPHVGLPAKLVDRGGHGKWVAWCRPGPRSRENTPGCTPGRRRRTRDGSLMRSAQSLAGVGTTRADAWWPQPSAHRVAESRRSAGLEPAGTPTTP